MTELIETDDEREERTVIVGAQFGDSDEWTVHDHLAELGQLVQTAGGTVVAQQIVKRDRPTAPFLIGRGKVDDLRLLCEAERADTTRWPEERRSAEANLDAIDDEIEAIAHAVLEAAETQ